MQGKGDTASFSNRKTYLIFNHTLNYSHLLRASLEAGKFCSESESSEMISVYQESISRAAVWLANGRI